MKAYEVARKAAAIMIASLAIAFVSAAAFAQQGTEAPDAPSLPSTGPVNGASYTVDPTHTFVLYEIGHYDTTTNRGRFSTSDGTIRIDPDGAGGQVDLTMDMSSINSGVDLLDRHLQSKDFFDVADFPTGRFVSPHFVVANGKVTEVSGSLTLLGKTKPVTLNAVRFNCYISPSYHRQVCGGDFKTSISRSDFGVTWGLDSGFADKVPLDIQIEAIQEQ